MAATISLPVLLAGGVDGDVAHACAPASTSTRSTAPITPPALADRAGHPPEHARPVIDLDADGEAVLRAGGGAHGALLSGGRPGMLFGDDCRASAASAARRRPARAGDLPARRKVIVDGHPGDRHSHPRRGDGAAGEPRLFLIDGNSLVYRAFFALPESIATSTGTPTNAIFGFASMLVKIVTDYGVRPTVVVWDAGSSGPQRGLPRVQGAAQLAPGPAQAAVAGAWSRWSRPSATATSRSTATRPTT